LARGFSPTISPVAIPMMCLASWSGSRGRLGGTLALVNFYDWAELVGSLSSEFQAVKTPETDQRLIREFFDQDMLEFKCPAP
jgi:hypothetical protein